MANVIILLSQEEFDLVMQDKSELINVNIAKRRNGPVGVVKLLFEKKYSRFQDDRKERVL